MKWLLSHSISPLASVVDPYTRYFRKLVPPHKTLLRIRRQVNVISWSRGAPYARSHAQHTESPPVNEDERQKYKREFLFLKAKREWGNSKKKRKYFIYSFWVFLSLVIWRERLNWIRAFVSRRQLLLPYVHIFLLACSIFDVDDVSQENWRVRVLITPFCTCHFYWLVYSYLKTQNRKNQKRKFCILILGSCISGRAIAQRPKDKLNLFFIIIPQLVRLSSNLQYKFLFSTSSSKRQQPILYYM